MILLCGLVTAAHVAGGAWQVGVRPPLARGRCWQNSHLGKSLNTREEYFSSVVSPPRTSHTLISHSPSFLGRCLRHGGGLRLYCGGDGVEKRSILQKKKLLGKNDTAVVCMHCHCCC
ncbi:unnamed protein product [Ectocarpus sp. 8 AP-2014]